MLDRTRVDLVIGPCAHRRPAPRRHNRQAAFGPAKSDCALPPSVFAGFSTCRSLLFQKMKSNSEGRLFDSISDIHIAVAGTLNSSAKGDFDKGYLGKCVLLELQTYPALTTAIEISYSSAYSYRSNLMLCLQLHTYAAFPTATDPSSCSDYSYRPILLL